MTIINEQAGCNEQCKRYEVIVRTSKVGRASTSIYLRRLYYTAQGQLRALLDFPLWECSS